MKRSPHAFEALSSRLLLTGEPTLVADLTEGRLAAFSLDVGSINDRIVFAAEDQDGVGLYSADPGEGSTQLLARVRPDSEFYSFGGALYFLNGAFLWRTDASPEGTKRVATLSGEAGFASEFVSFGDDFYFVSGGRLWKSDGTESGTESLRVGGGDELRGLAATNEHLYVSYDNNGARMRALDLNGRPNLLQRFGSRVLSFTTTDELAVVVVASELWVSAGSRANTRQFSDFASHGITLDPDSLTALGDMVYFVATNAEQGTELWATDGTAEGTRIVRDIEVGEGSSAPMELAVVGDLLYFSAETEGFGRELWKTDGTHDGTVMVDDIAMGIGNSNPQSIVDSDGAAYFFASDGADRSLWTSDGTAGGTRRVAELNPHGDDLFEQSLSQVRSRGRVSESVSAVSGGVVVRGRNELNREVIWHSDGASMLAIDTFLAEQMNSFLDQIVPTDPGVLLSGFEGLVFSDGTEEGTLRLGAPHSESWYGRTDFAKLDDDTYFIGREDFGLALWKTDGTVDGTLRVSDLGMEGDAKYYGNIANVNETLIFDVGAIGLWRSDGTDEGTVPIRRFQSGVSNFNVFGEQLLFQVGQRVWVTDGTSEGTSQLTAHAGITSGTDYNEQFLFGGGTLWLTDGTKEGTRELSPVASASDFTHFRDEVYFVGETSDAGRELWKTDGTSEGTVLVWESQPGPDSLQPKILGTIGSNLLATVEKPGTNHRVLWVFNESLEGTTHTDLIFPYSDAPATHFGDHVYFAADDGITGMELWRMNEELSVERVADIFPGSEGSHPDTLTVSGDSLFFGATHPRYGRELWVMHATSESNLLADFDRDGQVAVSDFLVLSRHFGESDEATSEMGDANGDGEVNVSDFLILSKEFGGRSGR